MFDLSPEARRRRRACAWALVLLLLAGISGLFFLHPVPQDPAYHRFADARELLGIPRVGDVVSNVPFFLVGAWGLWFLSGSAARTAFEYREERLAFMVLFAGVLLTGFTSAWYHLHPDNQRLVWDRLTITLGFMGIFSAVISERFGPRAGVALLAPLAFVGVASVAWWAWTEQMGRGDLRWYGLVQFYPIVAIALMLSVVPSRYTHGNAYWIVIAWYAAAKIVELLDRPIFSLGGLVSGHSLKHIFAAVGAYWVLRMLRRRSVA